VAESSTTGKSPSLAELRGNMDKQLPRLTMVVIGGECPEGNGGTSSDHAVDRVSRLRDSEITV